MQKKHSFSPNHKVVTDSKHNFHPHGAPTTASQGQPPQQMGASGDGTQAPQEGGGGMEGMNFCNGGMKYADGGETTMEKIGETVAKYLPGSGNDYDPNAGSKPATPLASGNKTESYEGFGGAARNATIDKAVKDAGG